MAALARTVVRTSLALTALAGLTSAPLAAADIVRQSFVLRGQTQYLHHLVVPSATRPRSAILFLPGDGGWRGRAVGMARMMASMGYDVYGFDVRHYLRTFTAGGRALTEDQMASDLEESAAEVSSRSGQPVILVGWSQGAAMVVLAAARAQRKQRLVGVLTISLPESASLAWRWRDSLFALFGRGPRGPSFEVAPLLPEVAPTPAWMIYGTRDRFTPASAARRLVGLARRPRRRREIQDGDHSLSGHVKELVASLRLGLAWIERQEATGQARAAAGGF